MHKTYDNFAAYARDEDTEKDYFLILEPVRIADGEPLTVRFSTSDALVTPDGENYFEPYIKELPTTTFAVPDLLQDGGALISYSEIVLSYVPDAMIHPSGLTMRELLRDYSFDGRPAELRSGGQGLAWDNFGVIMIGSSAQPSCGGGEWVLSLKSRTARLDEIVVPPHTYGNANFPAWSSATLYPTGSLVSPSSDNGHYYEATTPGISGSSEPAWGTSDGGTTVDGAVTWTCRSLPADTIGADVQVCLGPARHVPCRLIYEASGNYTYQYSDATWRTVAMNQAYDNGAPVTPAASSVTGNWLRFTTKPSGPVTADVSGMMYGGSYPETPGDIFAVMLVALGGEPAGRVDAAAINAYNTSTPLTVGLVISSRQSLRDAFKTLLGGLLTVFGDTREGLYFLRRIEPPTGSAQASYSDELNIITQSGDPDSPSSLRYDPHELLIWSITVQGDRIWSTNQSPASSLSAEDSARLAEEFASRTYTDQAVHELYPNATAETVATCVYDPADLDTVGTWWLAMFGRRVWKVFFTTKLMPLSSPQGSVIEVTGDLPGMEDGKLCLQMGFSENHSEARITPEAWT